VLGNSTSADVGGKRLFLELRRVEVIG